MTFSGLRYRLYLLKQVLFGKNLPVPKDEPHIKDGIFNTTPDWLKFKANANIFSLLEHIGVTQDYSKEVDDLKSLCRSSNDQDRNISEYDVNQLLYNLVRYFRPKRIIEVGTYAGTASCFLAAAQYAYQKERNLTLVELKEENTRKTRENLAKLNLEEGVTIHIGDSAEIAKSGKIEVSDFMFIDADHKLSGVTRDVNAYWPLLKSEGIMVLHDSISWNGVRTVTNKLEASQNNVFTLASSLASGISVIVKKSDTPF